MNRGNNLISQGSVWLHCVIKWIRRSHCINNTLSIQRSKCVNRGERITESFAHLCLERGEAWSESAWLTPRHILTETWWLTATWLIMWKSLLKRVKPHDDMRVRFTEKRRPDCVAAVIRRCCCCHPRQDDHQTSTSPHLILSHLQCQSTPSCLKWHVGTFGPSHGQLRLSHFMYLGEERDWGPLCVCGAPKNCWSLQARF